MSSSFPPGSGSLLKHAGVALSIITAIAGVWARFSAMEERQEAIQTAIVDLRQELQRLGDRAGKLEADRAMLERVHLLETQLAGVRQKLDTLEERIRRR